MDNMSKNKYLMNKMGMSCEDEFVNRAEVVPWYWFGITWDWAKEQDWWSEFMNVTWRELANHKQQDRVLDMQIGVREGLIDPVRFTDDIYKFLREREEDE